MSFAFLSPTKVLPFSLSTCLNHFSICSSPTRFQTSQMSLNSSSNPPSNNDDEKNELHSRFQEFLQSKGGNRKVQEELVDQVLQQATKLSTTEIIESKIETRMNAVSEYLDQLYSQFERDTIDKNEQLTIKTSMPTLSKWNQQMLHSGKKSKTLCDEIVQELEDVNNLLRKIERRNKRVSKTRVRYKKNKKFSSNVLVINKQLLQSCAVLLLKISVCTVAIDTLKKVTTSQSNYTYTFQQSFDSALLSGFIILSLAYVQELHQAVADETDRKLDLDEESSVSYQNSEAER